MNATEVADYLGVSKPTVAAAIRRGDLPVLRIGRQCLIPVSALTPATQGRA